MSSSNQSSLGFPDKFIYRFGQLFYDGKYDNESDDEFAIRKRRETAYRNLRQITAIHFSLGLFLLGSYARLTGVVLNAFAPKEFDKAFKENHLEIAIPLIVATGLFVIVDLLYISAIVARDYFNLNRTLSEFDKAQKEKNQKGNEIKNTFTNQKSTEILTQVTQDTTDRLNENKNRIIDILQKDIIIRQLLIQCDIHQQDLLEEYRKKENANIIELLKKHSEGLSLKDYKFTHTNHQRNYRFIEYIQGLKTPLRFTSVLLLLEGRAFECPDIWGEFGKDDILPGYYQVIITGGILLWAITAYAYYLQFKTKDADVAYNKDIREIRNTHHNALLSTLILALDRKATGDTPSIVEANTQDNTEKPYHGMSFTDLISWKWIPSLFLLGSLARRPLTIFALSDSPSSNESTIIVGLAVFLLAIADIYYIKLEIKEETWALKNQQDRKFVFDSCNQLTSSDQNPELNENENALYSYLNNQTEQPDKVPSYKESYPWLSWIKETVDGSLYVKFGLRAASLAFSIPQFAGVDKDLKNESVGALNGAEALMLFAGILGMAFGWIIHKVNQEKERRLNPSSDDKDYYATCTQNTSLFFKDPPKKQESRLTP